jgi:hypothetical protein
MASLVLLECVGCGLRKVRKDLAQPYKLYCRAISVGGAALARGTAVCGTCASQTRAGELHPVQLRATKSLSAVGVHARQTCPPGVLHLKPSKQKVPRS